MARAMETECVDEKDFMAWMDSHVDGDLLNAETQRSAFRTRTGGVVKTEAEMFDVKLDLEAAGGAAGGMSAGSDGLHKCKSCQQSQPIGIFNGLKTCPPCLRQSKRKRDQAREDKAEVERRKEELNARVESVRRSHQSLLGENARLHERRGMTPRIHSPSFNFVHDP